MDFAEKLVDELIIAVRRHEDSVNTGSEYVELDRLIECRKAIEGALRVPKGDDQEAWDRFAATALGGLLAGGSNIHNEEQNTGSACRYADLMLAERSRREAQP